MLWAEGRSVEFAEIGLRGRRSGFPSTPDGTKIEGLGFF